MPSFPLKKVCIKTGALHRLHSNPFFGGMGYCKDLSVERYYRDARVSRIYDGASEIHRIVIARDALRSKGALFDSMATGGWR